MITVNVVSTTLLVLLLLPTLRSFAAKWDIVRVITIVNSVVHAYTKWKTTDTLAALNNKEKAVMSGRCPVSNLLQIFGAREIADKIAKSEAFVILNTVNPGLCYTDATRNATGTTFVMMKVLRALLAWTAEEGSRTLVHATIAGPESHGIFISECNLKNKSQGKFVTTPEGQEAQKKVWAELAVKLEAIQPGITTEL